jgi:plasmid maintenance system antidote protein VapI
VLDCYRLARWYGQSPEVFLNMTFSEVRLHMQRSMQLAARIRDEQDEGE